jgi:endogenous inhibitor of DNA gyrase (YacG/DUF329 family)
MKINLIIEISPEEIFSAIRHMDFQEMARLAKLEKSAELPEVKAMPVLRAEDIKPEINGKVKAGDILISNHTDTPKKRDYNTGNAHNPSGKTAVISAKKCEKCGTEYQPKGNAQRFCDSCKDSHNKVTLTKKRNFKDRVCPKCGKTFTTVGPTQAFCSEQCGLKKKWTKSTRITKTDTAAPEEPAQKESYYHKKLAENKAAREEAQLIESFREHPKIDFKKLHNNRVPAEKIPAII